MTVTTAVWGGRSGVVKAHVEADRRHQVHGVPAWMDVHYYWEGAVQVLPAGPELRDLHRRGSELGGL